MATFYDVLRITRSASREEIKREYRRMATAFHPDRFPESSRPWAEQRMKEINEAYEVLQDPIARKRYDESLHPESANPPRPKPEPPRPEARPDHPRPKPLSTFPALAKLDTDFGGSSDRVQSGKPFKANARTPETFMLNPFTL